MSTPIRIIQGDSSPFEKFWNVKNNAESGETEIELYGPISEYSWFEDEVTPRKFKSDLYALGNGGPVTLRINSPGGDMIAAAAIASMINEYPGYTTALIEGMAASAATTIAIAANRVVMHESALFMIHDPLAVFFLAALNIEELERLTVTLKSAKKAIINGYMTRTGLSETVLSHMMTAESWMDAEEAKGKGFIDQVLKNGESVKGLGGGLGAVKNEFSGVAFVNALKNYRNVPGWLMERWERGTGEGPGGPGELTGQDVDPGSGVSDSAELERLRILANIWS